jgi:hypothetical protein
LLVGVALWHKGNMICILGLPKHGFCPRFEELLSFFPKTLDPVSGFGYEP